jgi:hypothetical protein
MVVCYCLCGFVPIADAFLLEVCHVCQKNFSKSAMHIKTVVYRLLEADEKVFA